MIHFIVGRMDSHPYILGATWRQFALPCHPVRTFYFFGTHGDPYFLWCRFLRVPSLLFVGINILTFGDVMLVVVFACQLYHNILVGLFMCRSFARRWKKKKELKKKREKKKKQKLEREKIIIFIRARTTHNTVCGSVGWVGENPNKITLHTDPCFQFFGCPVPPRDDCLLLLVPQDLRRSAAFLRRGVLVIRESPKSSKLEAILYRFFSILKRNKNSCFLPTI